MEEASKQESTGISWHKIVGALVLLGMVGEVVCRVYFFLWTGESYNSMSPYLWSPIPDPFLPINNGGW